MAVLFKKVNTLSKKSTDVVFEFPEFDRQNQDLLKIYLPGLKAVGQDG